MAHCSLITALLLELACDSDKNSPGSAHPLPGSLGGRITCPCPRSAHRAGFSLLTGAAWHFLPAASEPDVRQPSGIPAKAEGGPPWEERLGSLDKRDGYVPLDLVQPWHSRHLAHAHREGSAKEGKHSLCSQGALDLGAIRLTSGQLVVHAGEWVSLISGGHSLNRPPRRRD